MLNFGKESTLQAMGKSWRLKPLEVRDIRAFRDWIEQQIGDYASIADRYIDKLPPAEAMQLVKEVQEIRKQLTGFSLQCPIARQYLETESGIAKLVHILLGKHHPDATEDDAFSIVLEVGQSQVGKTLAAVAGDTPGNAAAPE